MAQTDVIKTKWLQRIVIGYVFVMVFGLIFFRSHSGPTPIFSLRFNSYSLISYTALIANLIIVLIVLGRRTEFKSNEATWYFLFLGAIIVFSACELLQRLSATPQGALFWAQLGGIGPAFEPVGIFLFALFYVSRRPRNVALVPLVILGGATLLFFHGNGGLVFQTSSSAIKLYPWGYNNQIGGAFALNAVWALGLTLLAVLMLLRFHRKSHNQILRRQSALFAAAFTSPLVGALVFDIAGPAIGLNVPPLHDVFTLITAALVYYGLANYKIFDVTPASLAGDILSTMSESVIVTDHQLRIELMNNQAEQTFDKLFGQVGGSSLYELFDKGQAQHIEEAIKKVTTANEKYTVGNFTLNNVGQTAYVRITAAKIIEEHGTPGYVFAIADISELQKSYDALEREKTSVEHKVEERTKELRQAQERLAETDKIKTEFVILTSHNLRTPLTAIKGNLEFLDDSHVDKAQKKFVDALQTATEHLDKLVEDLLTISQIEAGDKIIPVETTLQALLEPLVQEAKELASATHNSLDLNLPSQTVKVQVDIARIQTALHNLLDNAFKFTSQGNIKLGVAVKKANVEIKIIDNGIGISASELPKLFTKFHRSSGNRQNKLSYDYAGEGIGLYLTKLIVEEHGGTINVDSQPGKGSTFTIRLPIRGA